MRSHRFFLYFIIGSMFISLIATPIMPSVAAVDAPAPITSYWDKFTVLSSHFRPEVDIAASRLNNFDNVKSAKSNPVIESFRPIDSKPVPELDTATEKAYLYRSQVSFLWQAEFWTQYCATGYGSVFADKGNPYLISEQYEWLKLRTKDYELGPWTNPQGVNGESYIVNVGSYSGFVMKSLGHNGYAVFNLPFDDPTPRVLDFGNGLIMNPVAFVSTLEESVVVSAESGDLKSGVSHYDPNINIGVSLASVSRTDPTGYPDEAQAMLTQKISDLTIGVTNGVQTKESIQNGWVTKPQGRLVNDNKVILSIMPQVDKVIDTVNIKKAEIDIDTVKGTLSPVRILNSPIAVSYAPNVRCLGVEITNKYVFMTIRTTFILYSTAKIAVEQTSDPVNLDPDDLVQFDDMYWNNIVTGHTNVSVTTKNTPFVDTLNQIAAFWDQYGVWIIIGGVGAVAIGVFIYFNVMSGGQLGRSAGEALKRKLNKGKATGGGV